MCGNGTTCLEGCKPKPCPSGHVLDNERDMKCVLESHCKVPCKEIHGSVYYEGDRVLDERVAEPCESWWVPDRSNISKCSNTKKIETETRRRDKRLHKFSQTMCCLCLLPSLWCFSTVTKCPQLISVLTFR